MQFAFSVNDAHVHVCYSYNNKVIDMINLLGWLSIVCPIIYTIMMIELKICGKLTWKDLTSGSHHRMSHDH